MRDDVAQVSDFNHGIVHSIQEHINDGWSFLIKVEFQSLNLAVVALTMCRGNTFFRHEVEYLNYISISKLFWCHSICVLGIIIVERTHSLHIATQDYAIVKVTVVLHRLHLGTGQA